MNRTRGVVLVLVGAATWATLGASERAPLPFSDDSWNTYRHRFEVAQRSLSVLGAGSCSGSNCHGGATPRPDEHFLGDEWLRWYDRAQGPHFRAYKVLYEDDRSDRMAELLYGPEALAKDRNECLSCHGLAADEALRGRSYDIEEGVNCESCHGRSERWLGPHQVRRLWRDEYSVEQRTAMGYYDSRNLIHRTEKCLECHLGTDEKRVTHEMMAAGHPPLTFELVGDSESVPRHWQDRPSWLSEDEGAWFNVRAWAVGQAVMLRESMYRLAHWTGEMANPDYALFECYACHHDIKTPSWRQRRTVHGPLGEPTFDLSSWAMCRPVVAMLMPEKRDEIERLIQTIVHTMTPRGSQANDGRQAALTLAGLADELARKANETYFDRARTTNLLRAIADDREFIAGLGFQAAAQGLFAIDALYRRAWAASDERPARHDEIIRQIATLNDTLFDKDGRGRTHERSGDYDPAAILPIMEKLGTLLEDR
jgi:hypothetical protein